MKKKLFSIILTVTMLVSLLSFFSLSTGALQEWDYVSPGGCIYFPTYTYYYEVILTGFTRGQTYDIPLDIPKDGHVLVQSFGNGGSYAPRMTLLNFDGTEIVCQDNPAGHGFKDKGYNHQSLFQFLGGGSYILRLTPSTSENMRLSFTLAEYYFNESVPISTFNGIEEMEDGILEGVWTPGSHAFVGRFIAPRDDRFSVTTSGCPYMESYILYPMSNEPYAYYPIPGETEGYLYLEEGQEYYVVMLIPDGFLDIPPCTLRLTIG